MSNIKGLFLNFENLTDEEQINLWLKLLEWADKELPRDKDLILGIVKKKGD